MVVSIPDDTWGLFTMGPGSASEMVVHEREIRGGVYSLMRIFISFFIRS